MSSVQDNQKKYSPSLYGYETLDLLRMGGLMAVYLPLAAIFLKYFAYNGYIPFFSPASGFALGGLLLGRCRYWPGIFIGSLAAYLFVTHAGWNTAMLIALGNTLAACLSVWLLKNVTWFGSSFDAQLKNLSDYFLLVCVAGISALVAMLVGCSTLLWDGIIAAGAILESGLKWWMGEFIGVLLFTPILLAWHNPTPRTSTALVKIEFFAVFGMAFLMGQAIFMGWFKITGFPILGFWLILPSTWIALRFGLKGITLYLTMVSMQALSGLHLETSFLQTAFVYAPQTNTWFFLALAAIVGTAVGASIDSRNTVEDALRLSERNFRLLFDNAASGVCMADCKTGRFIRANKHFYDMLGYSEPELLQLSYMDVIHPDDLQDCKNVMQAMLNGEISKFIQDRRQICKDGQTIWVNLSISALWDPGETPGFVVAVLQNITDRLKIQRQQVTAMLETSPDGMLKVDSHGSICHANRVAVEMFGYSLEELIGRNVDLLLPSDARARHAGHREEYLKNPSSRRMGQDREFIAIRKDGSELPVQVKLSSIDLDNQRFAIAGISDISARKAYENTLRMNETKLRKAQDIAGFGNYVTDLVDGHWESSEVLDDIFGIDETYPHDIPGWNNLLTEDYRHAALEHYRDVVRDGREFRMDYEIIRPRDGIKRWVSANGELEYDSNGKPIRLIGTIQDITARKLNENNLQRQRVLYEALFRINEAIAIAVNEQQLFEQICHLIVSTGLMKLAWVGIAEPESQRIVPLVAYGDNAACLDGIFISINPEISDGQNLAGRAWRTKKPEVNQQGSVGAPLTAKSEHFNELGWRSCASFPVLLADQTYALFNFYDTAPNVFSDEIIALLSAMASHVGFALAGFKTRQALLESEEKFRLLANASPIPIAIYDSAYNVVYINPTLTRTFGYTLADIPSLAVWWPTAYPDPEYRQWVINEWLQRTERSVREHSEFEPLEVAISCKDGSQRTVICTYSPLGSASNEINHLVLLIDITDRKKAEIALKQNKEHLAEIVAEKTSELVLKTQELSKAKEIAETAEFLGNQALELARSGYWYIDFSEGDEYYISSERTVEIFGDPPRQNLHYHIMQDWYVNIAAVDPVIAENTLANYRGAVAGLVSKYDMIHPYRRPVDGKVVWVHVLGLVKRDAQGKATNVYGVVMDITASKLAEFALNESREIALKASKAKSEFLANMSHEIRTPMNGVIGMIDVLLQTELSADQQKMAHVIRDSAHTQLAILNDILDFSKIEAGKMQLAPEIFMLESVVESVCVMLDQIAINQVVDLKLFIDPQIPDLLYGDAQRLRQILTNLVNNAIKFSSGRACSGEVYVRAELYRHEADMALVRFSVRDNGIGINAAAQTRIFQEFEQADASTTRQYGGTGLGLVICNRLTEMMGGEISLQSTLGQGSVFTVSLPFKVPSEQPESTVSPVFGIPCLIIGSDTVMTVDIARHLRHAGALVRQVADINAVESPHASGMAFWIWVFDLYGTPAVDDIRRAAQAFLQDAANGMVIRHLAIARGRRRKPRLLSSDVVHVDGNMLTRHTILHALAVLLEYETPEKLHVEPGKALSGHPRLAREQALEQGRLILVVEDNLVNQSVIREQLKLLGLVADMAADGCEALAMWMAEKYPLILSDIHMPNMDGFQLVMAIRSEEAKSGDAGRVPIIALTAIAMNGQAENCKTQGFDDYLAKPAPLAVLKAIIDKWLPQPKKADSPAPENPVEPARELSGSAKADGGMLSEAGELPDWDDTVLRRMVGNEPASVRRFLQMFLIQGREQLNSLQAAALAADNLAMRTTAHTFKSVSRTVGALRLGQLCQELETAGTGNNLIEAEKIIADMVKTFEVVEQMIKENL